MANGPKNRIRTHATDEEGVAAWHQAAARDRRAVLTVDLTDEDIAAIEAREMRPGFEHLNIEVDDA
ncbi:hypothetical protein [Rhodopseudomonas parapalustris]